VVSSPVCSVAPIPLLTGPRQQGPVARDAERVVAVREVLAAGTDADSLLGRAVGYGHPRSHGDSGGGRPIHGFRRSLRSLHVNSGLLIKSSSPTLWDVPCAWVPPFAREDACRVALACLIGRAGHRWPGAPFRPMCWLGEWGGRWPRRRILVNRGVERRRTGVSQHHPSHEKAALAPLRLPSAAQTAAFHSNNRLEAAPHPVWRHDFINFRYYFRVPRS
jgi:hypothetical protein